MKKLNFFYLLTMLLVFASCSSSDDDTFEAYITVNGTSESEHHFPGVFDAGKSGIDYKQVFKVNSNVQWRLTGKVDWLNISSTTGKDLVDLSIYPTEPNEADSERTAELILSGEGATAIITITQGAGKPLCYVKPENEVALYNGICWEFAATENIDEFKFLLLSEWDNDLLTDKNLLEKLAKEKSYKYKEQWIVATNVDSNDEFIMDNSNYYLVTLAYDINGNVGELKKTKIKTPAYLDSDNDAWVNFGNLTCGYNFGFTFDAIKEGYCYNYHLIYGVNDEQWHSSMYAFQINYYLKYNKKHWFAENLDMEIVTDYPNSHSFTYYTSDLAYYPICVAYGWGIFKDGTLSSDLFGFQVNINEEESMLKAPSRREIQTEGFIMCRSAEEEKAKNIAK